MRVLIIEDEQAIREHLVDTFRSQGFAVDAARDGVEGEYMGNEYPIDVALVDLGLPGKTGIDVIQTWRRDGVSFPILVLTAKGRWQDKVAGLEAGADDYLVKPFHIEEVVARIRALVRRSSGWTESVFRCGPIALDSSRQTVTLEGSPIDCTAYEYKVLEYLMLHSGEVVSKSQLSEHIYEDEFDRDSNVLEVLIARLRKKLDPRKQLNPIETLRGRGYRFRLARTVQDAIT